LKKTLLYFWTFLIILGCSVPGNTIPDTPLFTADKFLHGAIFMIWAFLVLESYAIQPMVVLGLGVAFGLLIEVHQEYWLPYLIPSKRAFEWADVLADGLGGLVGVVLWRLMRRHTDKQPPDLS